MTRSTIHFPHRIQLYADICGMSNPIIPFVIQDDVESGNRVRYVAHTALSSMMATEIQRDTNSSHYPLRRRVSPCTPVRYSSSDWKPYPPPSELIQVSTLNPSHGRPVLSVRTQSSASLGILAKRYAQWSNLRPAQPTGVTVCWGSRWLRSSSNGASGGPELPGFGQRTVLHLRPPTGRFHNVLGSRGTAG